MELKIKYRDEIKILKFEKDKITANDILKELGLSPDYAFVVQNDEVLPEYEFINTNTEIEVINSISGG